MQKATSLTLALEPDIDAPTQRPMLFAQLMHTLRHRLHETDLSPLNVAKEHNISIRSVHYAFAHARATFIERPTGLRLSSAHRTLSDDRLVDLPVAEVAVRCGSVDPRHSARRFRQQFGQSPSQFRGALRRLTD